MVRLDRRKKKGHVYLYLEERAWIDGKSKRLWQRYLGPEKNFKELSKLALNVDIETETIEFGFIAALYSMAKKLGLVEIVNLYTDKRDQGLSVGEHMLIAAINRCVEPVSRRQLKTWVNSTALRTFYPKLNSALDSRSYWTHSRYLTKKSLELIEEDLAKAVIKNFGVSFHDLLFDPTNFFTYINPKKPNQTLPRHGHSKDGRFTRNLINFSLFCALDGGIPFLHLVYPGNVQDANQFKIALKTLEHRLNKLHLSPSTITLTFDKGNLSKDAFRFIDEKNFQYITSIRPSTQKELLSLCPEEFDVNVLPNGKKLGAKAFISSIYGKERRIIALYEPKRAKWLKFNYETKLKKKLASLENFFKDRLNTAHWSSQEKILKKCQRVLASKKFKRAIKIELGGEEGHLSLSFSVDQEAVNTHVSTLGKAFLMTNRTDLSAFEVAWAYRQQYVVERVFKLLKNPNYLSIRPMFAHVDSSVKGHAFICFLGLLLLSLLVRELHAQNIPISFSSAIHTLKRIKITKIKIPGKKDAVEHINKMEKKEKLLFNVLHLSQFL